MNQPLSYWGATRASRRSEKYRSACKLENDIKDIKFEISRTKKLHALNFRSWTYSNNTKVFTHWQASESSLTSARVVGFK